MRAIWINSERRTLHEVDYVDYKELGRAVGGHIACAWRFENGDVCYVDDEGLMKSPRHFFRILERPDGQPLAGNGILTGRDGYTSEGAETTLDPVTTIDELRSKIMWMDRTQVASWGKANASEPAVTFTSLGPDMKPDAAPQVIHTYGSLISDALKD